MSQLRGFLGRVGYKGNLFLLGGRAVRGEEPAAPCHGLLQGHFLGWLLQVRTTLSEDEEPKEGLEQSWGSGQPGEQNEDV